MSKRRCLPVFLFLCALAALPAQASQIPWDGPEMNELDFLLQQSGQGAWQRSLQPVSEAYALELLQGLTPGNEGQAALRDDLAARLQQRLIREGPFELSLSALSGYTFDKGPPLPLLNLQAAANPLLAGNEGLFTSDGHLGYLGIRAVGQASRYLQFSATPLFRFTEGSPDDDKASFFLKEGLLALQYGGIALEAGRGSVRWGVGRSGTMLFSGDAEPFNLVRLRTDRPLVGPSFLRYLGPTRFDILATYLDPNRVFPHSRILAVHFDWLPHPRFEFSLGQSVMFGGHGAPTNNPLVYFSEKVTANPNPANRNFLFSFRWRVPKLEIEPYGEIMLEDCCAGVVINARDSANLCGLYFPRIDPAGKADLALEWVRTNQITYRHAIYTSGYTYKNRMIGHPLGPDATGIYAFSRYFHSPALTLKMAFAFEQRGRLGKDMGGQPIEPLAPYYERAENRYRLSAAADWRPLPALTLSPNFAFERVSNWRFQRGVGKFQGAAGFDLRWLF